MQDSGQTHTRRLPGLDALKVAAVFLVLLQHVTGALVYQQTPGTWVLLVNGLSWIAVWLFFVSSGYLYGRRLQAGDFRLGNWIARRVKRLGVPYVLWSLLYLALNYAYAQYRGAPLSINWVETTWWGAAFYTLWFVPALLYVSVFVALLGRARRSLAIVSGIAATLLLISVVSSQTVSAIPFVRLLGPLAVYSAGALAGTLRRPVVSSWFWALVGTALVACASLAAVGSARGLAVATVGTLCAQVGSVVWLLAATSLDWSMPRWARTISETSLGFYLVHGGVLFVFMKILPVRTIPDVGWACICVLVVGAVSLGAARLMRAVPILGPLIA